MVFDSTMKLPVVYIKNHSDCYGGEKEKFKNLSLSITQLLICENADPTDQEKSIQYF